MALYIFNPSTEIALASHRPSFTPTKAVSEFEQRLALLPALYAPEGSEILIPAGVESVVEELPYYDWVLRRNMKPVSRPTDSEVWPSPWGWNKALLCRLRREGINERFLPSLSWIESYRRLAHRNTTIKLWQLMSEKCPKMPALLRLLLNQRNPREFSDADEAFHYIAYLSCQAVIKWPWSSSGRGVVFTADLSEATIRRRLSDAIQSQGSVMVEPEWERFLDFATEWEYAQGKVRFLGFSRFVSNALGRYQGNIVAYEQTHLRNIESHLLPGQLDNALALIPDAMATLLAPLASSSPLFFGIDMLADTAGRLNPCVEINLRMTMGIVALRLYSLLHEEFIFTPGQSCVKLQ